MARVRRTPEEARALILKAAREILLREGPARVRLKQVAKRAGISHGLITHYFGTIEGLVEETFSTFVLEMRREWIRRFTQDGLNLRTGVEAFFESLSHPLYGRLVAWGLLTGRFEKPDAPLMNDQGIRLSVDAVEARVRERGGEVSREDLEYMFLIVMTSAVGYRLGRVLMWKGLGREPSEERDAEFRRRITKMIQAYLDLPDELVR